MINSILEAPFKILDWLYSLAPIGAFFDMLEDITTMMSNSRMEITKLLEGIYLIVGKQLVIFILTCFVIICVFKIVMAIINIVYP